MALLSDTQRLYRDVEFLTSIKPARNYQNKKSLDTAAGYIYEELKKLDFDKLEYQDFMVRGGEKYRNVSAIYNGRHKDRIIIGAHYDVCGEQPGADDNASAVAGMLETAKEYLSSGKTVFFAVGLAHLLGDTGLVEALREAGYTVTLVEYASPAE